ncbi:carboxypeptidase regulatory-like domain-containing protein [Bremerella sp. JC817]|uniref:carboxypeptidase regulatory-like domain-containing protein n=1 Tax=Bremerella sp. JC817 TaxID=3231756 RepID=UPI0034584806
MKIPTLTSIGATMATAALMLLVFGCSQQSYGSLGGVTGTVTLNGKPHANAKVTFTPAAGRPSSGMTDENGNYELFYIRDTKGAEPGSHKVTIVTVAPVESDTYQGPAFKDPIPPNYNRVTELTAEVEKGSNTFDFDLKGK